MEVLALRNCNWSVKNKMYQVEAGKKYKFPSTLKEYILASGLFEVIEE